MSVVNIIKIKYPPAELRVSHFGGAREGQWGAVLAALPAAPLH